MKSVAEKLVSVEKRVAEQKGDMNLFALFSRGDSPETWDLLVAGLWIERSKESALRYLTEMVQDALSSDEMMNISRIVLIDVDNPELGPIGKEFQVMHGLVETSNRYFFGLKIAHAYIVTSQAPLWLDLLVPLFPSDARVELIPGRFDFTVHVVWLLGTDENRPNKRSKLIRLKISEEAIEDYKLKSQVQQDSDDKKLYAFVKHQLDLHDPEHVKTADQPVPEVEWLVTTNVLNS